MVRTSIDLPLKVLDVGDALELGVKVFAGTGGSSSYITPSTAIMTTLR